MLNTSVASKTPTIKVTNGDSELIALVALLEMLVTKFSGSVNIYIF
jgi:hypothetical protein